MDGWMDSKAGKLKDLPTLVDPKSPVIPRGVKQLHLLGLPIHFGLGDPHLGGPTMLGTWMSGPGVLVKGEDQWVIPPNIRRFIGRLYGYKPLILIIDLFLPTEHPVVCSAPNPSIGYT